MTPANRKSPSYVEPPEPVAVAEHPGDRRSAGTDPVASECGAPDGGS